MPDKLPDPPPPTRVPPPNPPPQPIRAAWLGYTRSIRILLVPQPDDRSLDQYLGLRDKVLAMVEDEKFLGELDKAWVPFGDFPLYAVGEALLMELRAFPLAVEVAEATEKPASKSMSWWKRLLGRGSTVAGSAKDILDNLPPYAKNSITIFKELLDLFRGGGE